MIKVNAMSLTYPSGKGVHALDFSVARGEVMGYLGPNGAGKTTTIRALLGFMLPDSGSCTIGGLDCQKQAPEIQRTLGYIPGEITFIDGMKGDEFLSFMLEMRGLSDQRLQKQLLERFELDPRGSIRKFSKGMKQKLAIVTSCMHDPDVLILDEPTSGLDPLMQNRFIELIKDWKQRGKTILMSSHSFEEVERTCDQVLIIRDGMIISKTDIQTLKDTRRRGYLLSCDDAAAAEKLLRHAGFEVSSVDDTIIEVFITGDRMDQFIKTAARCTVRDLEMKQQSLEHVFMQFYDKEYDDHDL
ncbi:MAG: ABC transporter ATP-binding protein [Spirochaetia bacterium]|nr:ABC transporter ATP-binding protein [Spirochaetia bacterium]